MGRDQNEVAARVVHGGAGLRLGRDADEAAIAKAIRGALSDPALRGGAARLASAIREEVAADRALAELETLAARSAFATLR
jgi:UDP:flavonoid glycosyltransferase YjiC (YdhE family)